MLIIDRSWEESAEPGDSPAPDNCKVLIAIGSGMYHTIGKGQEAERILRRRHAFEALRPGFGVRLKIAVMSDLRFVLAARSRKIMGVVRTALRLPIMEVEAS
jgi:hypothetical protein